MNRRSFLLPECFHLGLLGRSVMGLVNRGVGWGALAVLLCLCGGCGGPEFESPEATFQTAKEAIEGYDCQGFCRCLTAQARDEMAAGLVIAGSLAQLAADLPGPGTEKVKDRAKRIKAVLEKYGLCTQTMPRLGFDLTASKEQQRQEMLKLVEPIADRNAFIADFLRVILETADDPDLKFIEPDARLVDLKTGEDTATATFAQTHQGKQTTGPIAFERVDDQWKISRLPPLVN
jgi:hypothetical protein